jgi:hypothetical protein
MMNFNKWVKECEHEALRRKCGIKAYDNDEVIIKGDCVLSNKGYMLDIYQSVLRTDVLK